MAETTIEWTATIQPDGTVRPGYTFNPWMGCTKVHEGCRFCYAERDEDHRRKRVKWGPSGTRVLTSPENWRKPFLWDKSAREAGVRLRVFCASLADVFEDWDGHLQYMNGDGVLACDVCGRLHRDDKASNSESCDCGRFKQRMEWAKLPDVRLALFRLIDTTPNLDWLILTKRPENIRRMWPLLGPEGAETHVCPLCHGNGCDGCHDGETAERSNVWILTSVSDQASADKQIPELLKCRDLSPVLGISAEPLLGPVNLRQIIAERRSADEVSPGGGIGANDWLVLYGDCLKGWRSTSMFSGVEWPKLDWVIVGGESGPNARPMHPQWARDIRDQCQAAGVPYFFKQWGEWGPFEHRSGKRELELPYGEFHGDSDWVDSCMCEAGTQGMYRYGKKAAGRLLDGREWSEFPEAVTV